jgi:uncharacterized membrane protein
MAQTPTHVQSHVDTIAKHEQEFLSRRTPAERFGDSVASVVGNLGFAAAHIVIFLVWVLVNTVGVGRIPRFDPYPFQFLAVCLALEAILLASFILMRQARLGRRADEREHLILQILLLTEKEITAVVQMNRQIAAKIGLPGVAKDKEIEQLSRHTSIDEVAQTIQESISAEK